MERERQEESKCVSLSGSVKSTKKESKSMHAAYTRIIEFIGIIRVRGAIRVIRRNLGILGDIRATGGIIWVIRVMRESGDL